jgi:CBS domain containing-hemolysin-like protein
VGTALDFPKGEVHEPLTAFILDHLWRISALDDKLERGALTLEVSEMKGPKVEKVLIRCGAPESKEL